MPWRPLPRIAYAVATYPFKPSAPSDLPLELGDELYIIEEGGRNYDWYRGYLVAPPSLLAGLTSTRGRSLEKRVFEGVFPRVCVEVREFLGEDLEEDDDDPMELIIQGSDAGDRTSLTNGHGPRGSVTSRPESRHTQETASSKKKTPSKRTSASEPPGSRPVSRKSAAQKDHELYRMTSRSSKSKKSRRSGLPLTFVAAQRDPNAPKPPAPVPMLKIGDESAQYADEPLVEEISSCLREWQSTNLHDLLLAREYSKLEQMSQLVRRLNLARQQLLLNILTRHELDALREKIVWDLVYGNRLLNGDVIVRDPAERGRLLVGDDSAIEVSKLQSIMSLLDKPPTSTSHDVTLLHHLLLDIHSFRGASPKPTMLVFYLLAKTAGSAPRQISENFIVNIEAGGQPSNFALAGRMKALFTDLNAADIGEMASSDSALYLIVRVQGQRPFDNKTTATIPPPSRDGSRSALSVSSGSQKGRRSMMWSSKGNSESQSSSNRTRSSGNNSSSTSTSQQPEDTPTSQNAEKVAKLKRIIGMGAIRIDSIIRQGADAERVVEIWTPTTEGRAESTPVDIIQEILPSRSGKYKRTSIAETVRVHLMPFVSPDADILVEKSPSLLQDVARSPKIGFSVEPTKPRSDIYLTLNEAFFPLQGRLSHPKNGSLPIPTHTGLTNLQATLEVRKASGERAERCIFPSCSNEGKTAWRTPAISRGEAWNDVIRLRIPPDEVPGSHVVMSVADADNFPFALCWMPLWDQDAFIRDGQHPLLLYKYDEITADTSSGRGAYMSLPWDPRGKDEVVTGPVATMNVTTYLCSTQFSQDKILLSLFKWRDRTFGDLIDILRRIAFVPEFEIVKSLNEVFDSLFSILVDHQGEDEIEKLVFDALVTVIGIVHDRRFNLGPLVDKYADESFFYPFATPCLMRSFSRLLINPADPERARRLRATLKVGRQMMKFMIKARHQQGGKEADIGIPNGQSTFPRDLRAIFKSFEELMKNITPTLVGSKTLLVQHFHTWLPELSGILTHKEILQLAIDFLDSCSDVQGKLLLYKLVLIIHISELNFFPTPDLRRLWISSTARWLNPHWGTVDVFTEQWREQVRLCCSVLSTQIRDLGPEVSVYVPKIIESYRVLQAIPRQNKDTLSILFSKNYPFQTKSTSDKYAFDEAMIELASVLAAISQSPNGIALNVTSDDLPVTLFNILQMQLSILNFDSFPDSWFSLHIYHHKSALAILEYVSDVLLGSFLPPPDEAVDFKTELWKAFFETLLKLIGSDYLALEMFPEQKRRAVWKIAGDLREQGAELLRRTWEAIGWDTTSEDRRRYGLDKVGGYQVQYVPALVSQVVNLCMSAHEGLRRVAVDMLQTMIVSEWTLSGDLTVIKEEVVDCLDHLFRSAPSGEALTQKAFLSELTELFEPLSMIPDDPLLRALQDLVATTDEFLDILAAAHVAEMAGEASALMQTLNIMEFLREMKSDQNYIAHIHRLVEIQRKAGYHVEAGLAIKFHADLYEWNPTRILPEIHEPYFPEQTEFERKEHLYRKMIGWYNMGKAWDLSIAAHQELAANYRDITFNFRKLTKTEKDIADLHEHVADGEYSIPKYYRVIFRGLGWPAGIKDKQFIYTAFRTENTTKFSERILAQNPNATIVQEGDFDTREGQFIQIANVVPLRKFTHGSYQRPAVASSIRDFSTCASPELFVPVVRATSDVHDEIRRGKWVERYVYRTAEKFPTIARRSEIVETFPDRVSPIKSAIDRTSRKTQEMEDEVCWQISRAEDWEPTFPALLSSIRQSVSPKSTNSVAHYRELLPKAGAPNQEGNLTAEMNREEIALKVALIDHALVIKKALGLVIAGRHFPTIRELRENFEVTFAPELATKVEVEPDTLELDNDPPRPAEYRARTPDHNSEPLAPLSGEYHRPNPSTSHSRRSNNERQPTNSSVGRIGGTPNLPQFDGTAESFLDTGSTSSQADKSRKSRSPSHATSNGPQGQRPSSQMNHVSSETKRSLSEPRLDRPPTSSTTTTSMTQDDVKVKEKGSSGSIRKRFSVLGIGKKGSKNSVRDRSAFGAHQKVIEE